MLYLIEILHQTTTLGPLPLIPLLLYLIEILHQTTTRARITTLVDSCILSKFYIKPQLAKQMSDEELVVSYRNSTSNHNWKSFIVCNLVVVSYRNSTSNHNPVHEQKHCRKVVSYRNSTSNHNGRAGCKLGKMLYLIEILHQTTTFFGENMFDLMLYLIEILHQTTTAGHMFVNANSLYLIEILHQTTTAHVTYIVK